MPWHAIGNDMAVLGTCVSVAWWWLSNSLPVATAWLRNSSLNDVTMVWLSYGLAMDWQWIVHALAMVRHSIGNDIVSGVEMAWQWRGSGLPNALAMTR